MSATELLAELSGQGVQLWSDGGRLRARAPEGVLTPDLRNRLAEHKQALLDLLERGTADRPRIVPDPARRHEPFPLTDIQQAYLIGRSSAYALGRVACHAYYELDGPGLDLERLSRAWNLAVERHEMLRAVILPDGQQQILDRVPPYEIQVEDLRGLPRETAEARAEEIRGALSTGVREPHRWPLFEIRATRFADRLRVHLSLDLMVLDAAGMFAVLHEWSELYAAPESPQAPFELSFRDYVLAEMEGREGREHARAERYWRERLADFPPAPELPLARDPGEIERPRFVRRMARLEAGLWRALKERAARAGVTPSTILCAAYGETLAAWSKGRRFILTLPIFNRFAEHPELDRILGDFTTTLLLEFDGSPATFEARAVQLQRRLGEDLEHSRLSGVRIQRELARASGDPAAAVRPVVFTSLLGHRGGEGSPSPMAWLGELAWGLSQTPQVWLDHHVMEDRGTLIYNWDGVEDLFPAGLLDSMFVAYGDLLRRLAREEEAWSGPLRLTPEADLALAAAANATSAPVPPGLLQEPFLRQAAERPQAPAVISGDGVLTYGELHRRAGALAVTLRELGARPNRLIAVVMEKGWEQVVAVLGILQAGAAYLPISPDQPAERLRWILEHGEAELAVTQPHLDATLSWPAALRRLTVARGDEAPEPVPLEPSQAPDDIAYVIYTSGSTGHPKGVVIDHRGALNTCVDVNSRFGITPEDRVLALSSLAFDLSVWDLFGLLGAGGTVVLPEPWADREPSRWLEWLRDEGVTVWNTVPTLLEMLVEHAAARGESLPSSLRLVMLSGDWIPLSLPERLRALAPWARLISLGGATEASIWSILYPVERVDPSWRSVPYGRPMVNQTFHVLGEDLEPRPVLVPGHLYIGGVGLARGYWRDEEKTRSSFVVHPRTGERLYRTGDLGRRLPDGTIEFLGREDFQVKVQGHRIELGEIEAALVQHPSVRAAVAGVAGDPRGTRRLVAWVVPGANVATPTLLELREFLADRLPAAMIPGEILVIPELPLSSNGKIDRRALPLPSTEDATETAEATAFVSPRTPLERRVAALWGEVLGLAQVSLHDDFLRAGGSSLVAIRLANRLRTELGVDLPLRTLLRAGTVERLAEIVGETVAEVDRVAAEAPLPVIVPDPARQGEPFPLTEIQQAYWLGRSGAFELGNVAPHSYLELESHGLDLDRFESAWRRLIARHGMLRAVVLPDGRQQILERVPEYEIVTLDLCGAPEAEVEAALAAVRERMSHQVLATDIWPLFEIRASRLDGERVRLHLSLDLLIGDAWSMVILIRELADLYEGKESELPPLELSFRDYVLAWDALQGTPQHRRSLDYWRRRLPDLPPAPELPLVHDPATLDRPRFVRRSSRMPREAWARLQKRAAGAGLTPSSLLLAAFAETLAAWTKSPRFTLNTTLFNRLPVHPEVGRMMGDFTSMVLLEVDLSVPGPFAARARRVQERLWEDLDHRFVSGVRVLRELARLQGGPPRAAMPVVFTSTLVEGEGGERGGFEWFRLGEPVFSVSQTPQVWLDHQIFEDRGELLFNWDAVEDLFPPGLLDVLFAAYCTLLERLAAEEAVWSEPVRLTPAADLDLAAQANATDAPVPAGLLHERFLGQAVACPERTAVVAADHRLTYGELHRRAGALAVTLRELGARPNRLIAVVMEKGWEQVVAVLGILQAGAAYLPISPDQPAERLRWILEHGEAELAVTQPHLDATLSWPAALRRLTVARGDEAPEPVPLEPSQAPDDIAYVIYTSGSTGHPKGVVIDHRGALNTCVDVNSRFGITPEDRVLALSSLAFDLSVWDLFGLLGAGGTVVLPEPWADREPSRWLEWLRDEGVTVWNTVPTLLEMLVEHAAARGESLRSSLRLVMLSGDWIPLSLPERLRALAPGARLISLGGATEASIWSILYPVERVDPSWRSVPYGRPMANQTFHVLGEDLEPRPVLVPGHLYIGGVGLARGYWRDEEKTRSSFVVHPRTGERLYRTGDLGRRLPDGTIEFLGREDFQVKVQGHRIELGEIEAALVQHPSVRAAVAGVAGDPRGARRLVAWVVPAEEERPAPPPDPFHPEGTEHDPVARLEFKLSRPGIRRDLPAEPFRLAGLERSPEATAARLARRSHRELLETSLEAERLGALLSCLALLEIDGLPRYRYASAGGLYPVQTYVWVRPGRVQGLAGGLYYHHPAEHALLPMAPGAGLDPAIHAPVNRPVFAASAFSLFLVGQLEAIAPLYGDVARDFCLLEAGYMSQLLMTEAARHGIGLCPIGGYDTGPVRRLLRLGESQVPLHSLVGGPIDPAWVTSLTGQRRSTGAERVAELRDALAARLPAHMIPSAFLFVDALPLSSNGKVDRRRLPAVDLAGAAGDEAAAHVAPRTELERTLAGLLQEILEIDRVGVEESFFQMGASSIHIVQLNNRLRAVLGRELPIVEMFRCASIAALAALVSQAPAPAPMAAGAAGPTVPGGRPESRADARREEMARRRGARRERREDAE